MNIASLRWLPDIEDGGRPSKDDKTSSKDAEPGLGDRSTVVRWFNIVTDGYFGPDKASAGMGGGLQVGMGAHIMLGNTHDAAAHRYYMHKQALNYISGHSYTGARLCHRWRAQWVDTETQIKSLWSEILL